MKKLLYIPLLFMLACTNPETEVKQARESIMRTHDNMMQRNELIVKSKLQIDTLQQNMGLFKSTTMPQLDTLTEKAQLKKLGNRLQAADDRMSDWMATFDPAQEGKSTDEKKKYFAGEKDKLTMMNRTFDTVLTQSESYLQKFRKK